MDALMKLSREAQIVLGGLVLYVIFSFLDWQQVSFGPVTAGKSLWHGFGVIVALIALVFLAWEVTRTLGIKVNTGSITEGQVSAGLALLLALLTVIIFLDWSDFRHWPEWVGLVLSLAIAGAAFMRAKAEGVTMPEMPKSIGMPTSSSSSASSTAATPPPPAAPAAPPAEEAAPSGDAAEPSPS